MGRLLAVSFLGLLAFWLLAVASFVVLTVGRLVGADQLLVFGSLMVLAKAILDLAAAVFFLVAPLSLALLLLFGLRFRGGVVDRNGQRPWMGWKEPKVVVAVTAWNDEEAVRETVHDFARLESVVETIVVDNASDDNTVHAAREEGARTVIEPKRGYGNVCIRGLREALANGEANIVVLVEGDMTFCASDLAKMIPYLEDVDLVVGTRTTFELTDSNSQMDWFLSWGNLFLATLIRLRYWEPLFFGRVRLTDVGCTFRVMRKDSLSGIIDRLNVGDYHFSPHMILAALRARLRIIEVPIKFRKRVGTSKGAGRSRSRAMRIGLRMLAEIFR